MPPLWKHMDVDNAYHNIIWECTDNGTSNITKYFKEKREKYSSDLARKVISTKSDFLHGACPVQKFDIIVTNPPYCYDSQTETLTNKGWKRIADVSINDNVLSLNPETMIVEWDKIEEVISMPYKGEMYHFSHKLIDLLVTPNHRMYSVYHDNSLVTKGRIYGNGRVNNSNELITAEDIKTGSHWLVRTGFKWIGTNPTHFVLPDVSLIYNKQQRTFAGANIKIEDWVAFLGFWIAEGSTRGSTKNEFENHKGKQKHLYETSMKQKEPHATMVRELLSRLPFNFKERQGKNNICIFDISDVALWTYLHKLGNSHTKFIPNDIKNLSPRLLRILFDWYMLGDGCFSNNCESFFTVSEALANDLQEISVKLGSFTSCYKTHRGYNGCIVKQPLANIGREKQKVNYDGQVYCLKLQQNSIFLVRRNRKLAFCGNSLKDEFLKRCYEYGKPFALLLPITSLAGVKRGKMFAEYGVSVIVLNKRLDFTGKKRNWFNVSWFTWGLFDDNKIIFEEI